MSIKEIIEEYKKLNPNLENDSRFINPKLAADMKAAAERGDVNAVFYIADYFSDELKAECAKHPNIYEYEAMYENSPEIF